MYCLRLTLTWKMRREAWMILTPILDIRVRQKNYLGGRCSRQRLIRCRTFLTIQERVRGQRGSRLGKGEGKQLPFRGSLCRLLLGDQEPSPRMDPTQQRGVQFESYV